MFKELKVCVTFAAFVTIDEYLFMYRNGMRTPLDCIFYKIYHVIY